MIPCQDVTICDCEIKQEPGNIFIIFSALQSNIIIASQLVVLVNTSHVLVVLLC